MAMSLETRLRMIAQDDALYGPSDGRIEERNRILDALAARGDTDGE